MTEANGAPPGQGIGALTVPDRLDRPISDPLFDRLFPPLPSGVHWGLERVERALEALGNPERCAPVLHVGGTNGKGSVCSTVASILCAGGHRVGLYTSPHLCSLTERFQIDGRPVEADHLVAVADRIRPTVAEHGLTFFEAMTVLGFALFQEEGVDVQVIEVGLGGRLDATNVVHPAVTLLTNVADDHAEFLGESVTEIAREKAGILKAGVPALTTARDPEVLEVFRSTAQAVGAPLTELDPAARVTELEMDACHDTFHLIDSPWGDLQLDTPLIGVHQAANVLLAVHGVGALPDDLRPSAEAVRAGVSSVRWPGRDQVLHIDQGEWTGTWVFDVAHNAAGIESLGAVLDRLDLPRPVVAVVGVLGDKNWRSMLPPLISRVSLGVLTQPPTAPDLRRWDPSEAREALTDPSLRERTRVVTDFRQALQDARRTAGAGSVVVTGSCHTVGDAMAALGRVPFASDPE